jgi:hypothetical protein
MVSGSFRRRRFLVRLAQFFQLLLGAGTLFGGVMCRFGTHCEVLFLKTSCRADSAESIALE